MSSLDHLKKRKHLIKVTSPQHFLKTGKAIFQTPQNAFFGSFDPFTKGHLEVYASAKQSLQGDVDFVIVRSLFKNNPTFSLKDREEIIKSYVPGANVYYARDYHEIKKLKVKSSRIIKGKRNREDEDHTNFVFEFYEVPKDKLHQVDAAEHVKQISSRGLKELIMNNEYEAAGKFANSYTIKKLKDVYAKNND